jgi:hypothetical protein
MTGMRRRLFNLVALLSLTLCVAMATATIRSRAKSDVISWIHNADTILRLDFTSCVATIEVGRQWSDLVFPDGWYHSTYDLIAPMHRETLAFRHEILDSALGGHDRYVIAFPLWLVCFLFGITPVLWLILWRRAESTRLRTRGRWIGVARTNRRRKDMQTREARRGGRVRSGASRVLSISPRSGFTLQ